MKATVKVENLKIYAYHGCMEEEKIIGSDYVVNVTAECLLEKEAFEDDISKTVNYVDLASIVTREMGVRSKMLESVVKRICSCSLAEISLLEKITVCVSKICPPINADVERVTVCLTDERNR